MKYYCFGSINPTKFNYWQIINNTKQSVHEFNRKEDIFISQRKRYYVSYKYYNECAEKVLSEIENLTFIVNSKPLGKPYECFMVDDDIVLQYPHYILFVNVEKNGIGVICNNLEESVVGYFNVIMKPVINLYMKTYPKNEDYDSEHCCNYWGSAADEDSCTKCTERVISDLKRFTIIINGKDLGKSYFGFVNGSKIILQYKESYLEFYIYRTSEICMNVYYRNLNNNTSQYFTNDKIKVERIKIILHE